MGNVKNFIDDIIANNKVVVFSKSYCPYCTMAKDALQEIGVNDYFLLEIESRPDCGEIQDYLLSVTGGRTVPRVFINGKFIGGGTEVNDLKNSGKLKVLVHG